VSSPSSRLRTTTPQDRVARRGTLVLRDDLDDAHHAVILVVEDVAVVHELAGVVPEWDADHHLALDGTIPS